MNKVIQTGDPTQQPHSKYQRSELRHQEAKKPTASWTELNTHSSAQHQVELQFDHSITDFLCFKRDPCFIWILFPQHQRGENSTSQQSIILGLSVTLCFAEDNFPDENTLLTFQRSHILHEYIYIYVCLYIYTYIHIWETLQFLALLFFSPWLLSSPYLCQIVYSTRGHVSTVAHKFLIALEITGLHKANGAITSGFYL